MASSKAAYLQKYLSGGKKTKKKAKKKVASKGAVKLIDEDDDWRTYAPSGQSNIDYVTAERGENAPVVVVQDEPPKAAKPVVRAQSGNWASGACCYCTAARASLLYCPCSPFMVGAVAHW